MLGVKLLALGDTRFVGAFEFEPPVWLQSCQGHSLMIWPSEGSVWARLSLVKIKSFVRFRQRNVAEFRIVGKITKSSDFFDGEAACNALGLIASSIVLLPTNDVLGEIFLTKAQIAESLSL